MQFRSMTRPRCMIGNGELHRPGAEVGAAPPRGRGRAAARLLVRGARVTSGIGAERDPGGMGTPVAGVGDRDGVAGPVGPYGRDQRVVRVDLPITELGDDVAGFEP